MIVRITRAKVGHRQAPTKAKAPSQSRWGFCFLSDGAHHNVASVPEALTPFISDITWGALRRRRDAIYAGDACDLIGDCGNDNRLKPRALDVGACAIASTAVSDRAYGRRPGALHFANA